MAAVVVVVDDVRIKGANDVVNIEMVVHAKSRNLTGLNLNDDNDDEDANVADFCCFFFCPVLAVILRFFLPSPSSSAS